LSVSNCSWQRVPGARETIRPAYLSNVYDVVCSQCEQCSQNDLSLICMQSADWRRGCLRPPSESYGRPHRPRVVVDPRDPRGAYMYVLTEVIDANSREQKRKDIGLHGEYVIYDRIIILAAKSGITNYPLFRHFCLGSPILLYCFSFSLWNLRFLLRPR